MKKNKIYFLAVAISFLLTACASNSGNIKNGQKGTKKREKVKVELSFIEDVAVRDEGNKSFKSKSVFKTVNDMTVGWNLGNTLDAPNETAWGQPKTTKAMIDGLAASGIKTIRIPVSWSNHIITSYTIDPIWMERVKTIVDWAIEDGMYVILNSHHDNFGSPSGLPAGKGYYPNSENLAESERYVANIWTQIALAFNNGYDEHLIFETLNEPRLCGTKYEWWFDQNSPVCVDAANCLNRLNQVAVDAIRTTGGNNEKRYIMCPGLAASPASALASAFVMPEDDEEGRLILSVHMYSPYKFAMESPGAKVFSVAHKNELAMSFKNLNENFIEKGYPVVIGEMGAVNKNNLEQRVLWAETFISLSRRYGMTSCIWDNGAWQIKGNDYNEKFGYYNRRGRSWYFPEIIETMVKTAKETKVINK